MQFEGLKVAFLMLTIRQAGTADIPLIHRLAWQVFPATYRGIISTEQSDYMMEWMYSSRSLHKQMEQEHHTFLLAYEDETPVGYVSVQPQGNSLWHLQKIYVLPSHQKGHVGRFLFEHAVDFARRLNGAPCRIELNVNRHNKAVDFYKHMGMRMVRTEDNDIGLGFQMNDYVMAIDVE